MGTKWEKYEQNITQKPCETHEEHVTYKCVWCKNFQKHAANMNRKYDDNNENILNT